MNIVVKFVNWVKYLKEDIVWWLEWHIFGCIQIPSLPDEEIKAFEGKESVHEDPQDVWVFTSITE